MTISGRLFRRAMMLVELHDCEMVRNMDLKAQYTRISVLVIRV